MPSNNLSAIFNGYEVQIIDIEGQHWLTSADVSKALGYVNSDSITRLYNRNKDEFDDSMTQTVKLTVKGQRYETRVFNKRGAQLIGFFAKTKVAAAFRRWVLDTLHDADTDNKTPSLPAIAGRTMKILTVIDESGETSTTLLDDDTVIMKKHTLVHSLDTITQACQAAANITSEEKFKLLRL